jgi:type IV pilus assembly protein PilE
MHKIQHRGMTLIELMIVVVIVGVLAGIAYPSYQKYTMQARRSDGQIALTRIAAAQEKFYSDCSYYAASLATPRGCLALATGQLGFGINSPDGHYSLAVAVTASSSQYTATATALGRQADDTDCASLTLNYQGVKGGTTSNCWKK